MYSLSRTPFIYFLLLFGLAGCQFELVERSLGFPTQTQLLPPTEEEIDPDSPLDLSDQDIIRGILAMPITPLPQSVYNDIANPEVSTITIPKGRYSMTQSLTITRPNLTILADDVIVRTTVNYPVSVGSRFLETGSGRTEHHATGIVDPGTDTLTLVDGTPLYAGEVVLVRLGINWHDPAEPESQAWVTVRSVSGNTVRFEQPFGRTVTQWASYDALVAVAGEYWRFKTGPWEARPGYYSRGLGLDHGIVRFAGGQPARNVTIQGLTVERSATAPTPYGAWSFSAAWAQNVHFKNVRVINPRGSSVHLFASEDSGVDGLTILGDGDSNDWNDPNHHNPSGAVTLWGGINCYGKNIYAVGKNITLTNCEVGSRGTTLENASIKTAYDPGVQATQFGIHGDHPNFTLRNIEMDVPQSSSGLFPSSLSPNVTFENLKFVGEYVPDWIPLARLNFLGTLQIGKRIFGPMRQVVTETLVTNDGTRLNIPSGIYKNARVVLPTRTGIRGITTPTNIMVGTTGLTLNFPSNEWGYIRIGTIVLPSIATVFLESGAAPVLIRFEGDMLQEQ